MSTTTNLTTLKINYLTQAQYDAAVSGGTINENEIYMTPKSDSGSGIEITPITELDYSYLSAAEKHDTTKVYYIYATGVASGATND